MFDIVPYWYRVALLLVLMSVVAAIDWRRNGQNATKWKEYGFVVASGAIGALFGLFNDLVTSTISPEYFIFGKGLASGAWLTMRAGVLGMKAGFSAGASAGAICLYVGTRACSYAPLVYRSLLGFLWRPVALAMGTALLSALFFHRHDPFAFSEQMKGVVNSQQLARFLIVWWIHAGLYLGLLMSVVWIIVDSIRLRHTRTPVYQNP